MDGLFNAGGRFPGDPRQTRIGGAVDQLSLPVLEPQPVTGCAAAQAVGVGRALQGQPAVDTWQLAAADTESSGWLGGTDALIGAVVVDAMRQLPVEQRAVIYRSYYQRWTIARIAADLKLTEATVNSQLHYGLHALRLRLHEMGV